MKFSLSARFGVAIISESFHGTAGFKLDMSDGLVGGG